MTRRLAVCVALVALVAGACGSSAPVLTDPKDIVVQSVAAVQSLKSFHLHVALSGTLKIDLLGSGKPIAVDLQGATVDLDVDSTNAKVKASLSAPSLFINGDLIYVGSDVYVRATPLLPKYRKFSLDSLIGMVPGLPSASATPSVAVPSVDPSALIAGLKDALNKLALPPVKDADEKIGDQDCYKVTIKLSSADLATAAPSLPPTAAAATFAATLDVWVRKSDLRPAQIVATVDAGDTGKVTLTMTLSKIDAPVVIDAPPADQIDASK